MCRETESYIMLDEDGAEFNDISYHIFTTVSVSRHIATSSSTSRPARVWRVTRSEPETTRATHRQETKTVKRLKIRRCPCGDEDSFESQAVVDLFDFVFVSWRWKKVVSVYPQVASATPSPPHTFPIGSHLVVRLTAAPPAPIEPLEPPLPIPNAPSRNLHEEVQRRAQSGELNKTRRHSNCPYEIKINSPEQRRKTPRSSTLRNFPVIKKHDVSPIASGECCGNKKK